MTFDRTNSLDRLDSVLDSGSERHFDNFLIDLSGAVHGALGRLDKLDRQALEGRLGPMAEKMAALSGDAGGPGIGVGAPASSGGNSTPKTGQGNLLSDPGLDTVAGQTLGTGETQVSWDLKGKYALASGSAPTVRELLQVPLGYGSTMASSMAALRISGASSAGNITASIYTKGLLTIGANTADLPYVVASARLWVYGSPNNATNVTAWTATVEVVQNIASSETIVSSMEIDLLAMPANADALAFAAAPAPLSGTYDVRVKVNFVTTGSAATNLRLGIGEIALELAYTSDPTAFVVDRSGSRFWYGDGSDGDVTIASGTTTLTSDKCYETLTIAAGAVLATAGYKVFGRNKIVNAGTIRCNGSNASGQTGGTAAVGGSLAAAGDGGNGGSGSGSGTNGVAGTGFSSNGIGGNGGVGGTSSSSPSHIGGSAGYNTYLASRGAYRDPAAMRNALDGTAAQLSPGAGGGGGGGGYLADGTGGGGGGGGGMVVIAARIIDNSAGTIQANGGNGANGSGTGGGGGGGGGGAVLCVYDAIVKGTEQAAGGSKGTGGAGNAADGSAGQVLYVRS